MGTGSALAETYAVGRGSLPARREQGVRVVLRDNGRFLDLLPSALSSYLLPGLADFSAVRREARSKDFGFTLLGGVVQLEETAEPEQIIRMRELFASVGAALTSIGAVGSFSLQALGQVELVLGPGRAGVVIDVPAPLPVPGTESPTLADEMGGAVTIVDEPSALEPLARDASVAEIASRIAALSGLSDEMLAELFKIERETFCRWRSGALANPRVGNRRRLGLLLALLEEMAGRGVNIKDWLLNFTTPEGLTPYQLLDRGRIDEVAYLASSLGEPEVERDARVSLGQEREPLRFGDDDVWELQPLDDEP